MGDVGSAARSALGSWLVCVLQAFALWGLHESLTSGTWPASDPGLLFALYPIVIFVPLTLLLLWSHVREHVLWIAAVALALFLFWTGRYVLDGVVGPVSSEKLDEDVIAAFVLPFIVAWLIAIPLLRARLESGRWHAAYPILFRGASRSYLTLLETALFTGVFWALLALWAGLFAMLGNNFFRDAFADPRFFYPATTLAVATAIRIIGTSDRLVDGVLDQLLGLLKWLAPLAGLIVVLFTFALLPKLPALFSSGEKVLNSAILLALVAMTLLLLNAAYRDGEQESGYGLVLQRAMRLVPPLLAIVALTALASMVIRTVDLGLTPPRFWGLMTATFAVLFSVGYAIAAIRRVNFLLAVVLLLVLVISLTPFGSPLRWSIAQQVSRAMTAAAETDREGALRFLRFDAGAAGRAALEDLAGGQVPGALASLRAEAQRVAALESRRSARPADPAATPARYAKWRGTLQILPVDRVVPLALEEVLQREFGFDAAELDPGGNAPAPRLIFIDLNGDGLEDAMLLSGTLRGDPQMVRDSRYLLRVGDEWRLVPRGGTTRR